MRASGVDVIIKQIPANVCYLSGYSTIGVFEYFALVIPGEGDPILVVRHLELDLARERSCIADIVSWRDDQDPLAVTASVVRDRGFSGRIGIEDNAWFFTPKQHADLMHLLSPATIVQGGGIVEAMRVIKSPAEIAAMRVAAHQADCSTQAGLAAMVEGNTENDVAIALHRGGVEAGSDYISHPYVVTSGRRTGLPHATWSGRRFERGDLVRTITGGCHKRYGAAIARTATIGPAKAEHRRIAEVAIAALNATLEVMRPGATSREVNAAAHRPFEQAGMSEAFRHRTGYSIGLNFPPHWGEAYIASLKEGDDTVLVPGMAFHCTPGYTKAGEFGIGLSETILVTPTGSEALGKAIPRELIELGA
jgi:Xaa-Pro dipeptidase